MLATVILLTSGATFVMGLLPTYHQIGITATVLLVITRLVQGFAAGGESSGATTYPGGICSDGAPRLFYLLDR